MSDTQALRAKGLDPRRYLRSFARRDVSIAADLEIILRDGRVFTTGSGIIRNISLRGALLAKIVLKKKALPAEWFRVRARFKSAAYKGIGALCRPVRFGRREEFEIGVEFDDFWARTDEKR